MAGVLHQPAQMRLVVAGTQQAALQVDRDHAQLALAGQPDMGRLDGQLVEIIAAEGGDVLLGDGQHLQRKRVARAVDDFGRQHPGGRQSPPAEAIAFFADATEHLQLDPVEYRHTR